jgi:hypothetical protein
MNPEEKEEIRKVISGKICELEKSVETFKRLLIIPEAPFCVLCTNKLNER